MWADGRDDLHGTDHDGEIGWLDVLCIVGLVVSAVGGLGYIFLKLVGLL